MQHFMIRAQCAAWKLLISFSSRSDVADYDIDFFYGAVTFCPIFGWILNHYKFLFLSGFTGKRDTNILSQSILVTKFLIHIGDKNFFHNMHGSAFLSQMISIYILRFNFGYRQKYRGKCWPMRELGRIVSNAFRFWFSELVSFSPKYGAGEFNIEL